MLILYAGLKYDYGNPELGLSFEHFNFFDPLHRTGHDLIYFDFGPLTKTLSHEEMIRVFNQSRINLNLSNAAQTSAAPAGAVETSLRRRVGRALERIPLGKTIKALRRRALGHTMPSLLVSASAAKSFGEQIKGRNFEVPGRGGFMLTGQADNLEQYYAPDREIACFDGVTELIRQARHFLKHEDARAAVARAGYERTIREHTYAHRFHEIFQRMQLPAPPLERALKGEQPPGSVVEIS